MPKFVPVVDTEKPLSEQIGHHDPEYDKHRRFDNPHAVHTASSNKKVDRGWQQGSVGWGVLKNFGGNERDGAAQVMKHSEGSNKMVKNEKGLWVKAKAVQGSVGRGNSRGRGGGVPVLRGNAGGIDRYEEDDELNEFLPAAVVEDPDDYQPPKRKRMQQMAAMEEDAQERRRGRSRSEDRGSRDRRDVRKEQSRSRRHYHSSRSNSRSRDRGSRSRHRRRAHRSSSERSRSRSREYRHKKRSRRDYSRSESSSCDNRRRRRYSKDRHRSRHQRSRSNSSDRDRHRPQDKHRERRRYDDHRRRRRSRSSSSSRSNYDNNARRHQRHKRSISRSSDRRDDRVHDVQEKDDVHNPTDSTAEEANAACFNFSAIQVLNRFHEVYGQSSMDSSRRLDAIAEVFADNATILSLKPSKGDGHSSEVHAAASSGAVEDPDRKVLLQGRDMIRTNFARTKATKTEISKRLYIDCSGSEGQQLHDEKLPVTFCFDLHRPGTSPGLGDKAKHTALLYRCCEARLTHVWGSGDTQQLAADTDLKEEKLLDSKVWLWAVQLIQKDYPQFTKQGTIASNEQKVAHYHNYDKMEVWGFG